MSGKPITKQQVKLYMSYRNQPKQTQVKAAAKAGFSESRGSSTNGTNMLCTA